MSALRNGTAEPKNDHCQSCGSKVVTPKFLDTRGRVYCNPDCWEIEPYRREISRIGGER